jgi:hypothetical protein
MTTPGPYKDHVDNIDRRLDKIDRMERIMEVMAKQIHDMYYDIDPPPLKEDTRKPNNVEQITEPWDYVDEETIKKNFDQRIPYNLIDDPRDVAAFKDFIYKAKHNHKMFNEQEMEYIDYADKNFKDIRLTRKHLGILQNIYTRLYTKSWPFKTKHGWMYKLGEQMCWEWIDP